MYNPLTRLSAFTLPPLLKDPTEGIEPSSLSYQDRIITTILRGNKFGDKVLQDSTSHFCELRLAYNDLIATGHALLTQRVLTGGITRYCRALSLVGRPIISTLEPS